MASTFGPYLRQLRERRRLSRSAVACRCAGIDPTIPGLSEQSLKLWETEAGGRLPNLGQFEVIAEALALTIEERLHALRLARMRVAARARELSEASAA